MLEKTIMFVVSLVLLITFFVFCVQTIIPMKLKIDFNDYCRRALIRIENNGGITSDIEDELRNDLTKRGFFNINISGDSNVKKGSDIYFHVEAQYQYRKIVGIYISGFVTSQFIYDKKTVSRKVIN